MRKNKHKCLRTICQPWGMQMSLEAEIQVPGSFVNSEKRSWAVRLTGKLGRVYNSECRDGRERLEAGGWRG